MADRLVLARRDDVLPRAAGERLPEGGKPIAAEVRADVGEPSLEERVSRNLTGCGCHHAAAASQRSRLPPGDRLLHRALLSRAELLADRQRSRVRAFRPVADHRAARRRRMEARVRRHAGPRPGRGPRTAALSGEPRLWWTRTAPEGAGDRQRHPVPHLRLHVLAAARTLAVG